MNISLSKGLKTKGGSKSSSSLGYGLNSRKSGGGGGVRPTTNVFGDDSDDDSTGESGSASDNDETGRNQNGRRRVNNQIAKEQDALRKRAQAALQTMDDPSVYDYDGAYETYNTTDDGDGTGSGGKASEPKTSRYIGKMLKEAKTRERERDARYERKVAREQAEEEAQEEYQGKEKFVTKAYKRKLEERKRWESEQEAKAREEEENDVTKKSANAAFASFYSNLNQVQRGEEESKTTEKQMMNDDGDDSDFDPRKGNEQSGGMGFLGGFEQSSLSASENNKSNGDLERSNIDANKDSDTNPAGTEGAVVGAETPMTVRQRREKKVAEARIRYLKRRKDHLELKSDD